MRYTVLTEREHKKVHVSATREARENKSKITSVRRSYRHLGHVQARADGLSCYLSLSSCSRLSSFRSPRRACPATLPSENSTSWSRSLWERVWLRLVRPVVEACLYDMDIMG